MTDIVERLGLLKGMIYCQWGHQDPEKQTIDFDGIAKEAADEIERMREALDQALDDMGANGVSVCGATKAQMRYALGKNVDPEFDYYPLDRAISVLVDVGQFKSTEQAYEALGEKE